MLRIQLCMLTVSSVTMTATFPKLNSVVLDIKTYLNHICTSFEKFLCDDKCLFCVTYWNAFMTSSEQMHQLHLQLHLISAGSAVSERSAVLFGTCSMMKASLMSLASFRYRMKRKFKSEWTGHLVFHTQTDRERLYGRSYLGEREGWSLSLNFAGEMCVCLWIALAYIWSAVMVFTLWFRFKIFLCMKHFKSCVHHVKILAVPFLLSANWIPSRELGSHV